MDAEIIEKAIRDESSKLILRYEAYHNSLHLEWMRNKKRTGKVNRPGFRRHLLA